MISRSAVAVLSVSAVVGAISAVVAVALYRDVTRGDSPLPVPSEATDNDV
jgi:hypothetical protein